MKRDSLAQVRLIPLILVPALAGCVMPDRREPLTYDAIYGPSHADFEGSYAKDVKWTPDGQFLLERRDGVLYRVDPAGGEATPAYDHEALRVALEGDDDFDAEAAKSLARHPTVMDDPYSVALLAHHDRLYVYHFADGTLKRLTDEEAERRELTLSPDATRAAFVCDHDLYSIDLATGAQTRVTHDGSETILNGVLDWVYQEEVYGRGKWRAYWWSEDGAALAYVQLDDADVPVYPLLDYLPQRAEIKEQRYPQPGDPNPRARLGVVRAQGGETQWIDLAAYGDADILLCGVQWAPDGALLYCVMNREGTWLDLNEADPETGTSRRLLRETTAAWIDHHGMPHWLDDGSFLWLSERTGWKHIYHYTGDGRLLRRITAGDWEARKLHGVDEAAGWVYFSGTCDSSTEVHVYRVPLATGRGSGRAADGIERLTEPGYTHRAAFDPDCRYFIDTFSSVTTPTKVALRRSDGSLVRVISPNEVHALAKYRFITPEFLRIPTPAGHALNGRIIRPPRWNPFRRRPVVLFTYGGPHGPSVHNRWSGKHGMFEQLLAQEGYLVWTVDPCSASGEGAASAWRCYQRLGVTELADLEASLRWLAAHENADPSRVAITGHSYGGFMVAYAMTHSTLFKVGIAAAAVTDWRNYDSVYTERFMRTPENNPQGYETSSAVSAAANLHGHLLLVHGGRDDNVHVQNAVQLIDALLDAGRDFDAVIYPDAGHGLRRYPRHWNRLRYEYIKEKL